MIDPNTTLHFIYFNIYFLLFSIIHLTYPEQYENFIKSQGFLSRFLDQNGIAISYFLIYFIPNLIIYYTLDIGIYNEIKNLYLIASIVFLGVFDFIVFIVSKRNTKKRIVKITVTLGLIWVLLVLSISINTGSTFSPMDHKRQWEPSYNVFEFQNQTYNASVQISTSTSNLRGYFIDEPLSLSLYEGRVFFHNGSLPDNSTLSMQVELFPQPYYVSNRNSARNLIRLETERSDNKTFKLKLQKKYWIIYYDMSGEKTISGRVYINDSLVFHSERVPFLEIEKGHVKSQMEMTRAITILTFWLVFIGLLPRIDPFFDWLEETFPERYKDKKRRG